MWSALIGERLAAVLLVQALRIVAASGGCESGPGWLTALADAQVGDALRLMHANVARRWTVGELASAVAMSRSSFALRFRRLVGEPPLEYLLRRRMRTAAAALRDPARTVGSVGYELGYTSDSAFSNAFKRVMGVAATHHRAIASLAVGPRLPFRGPRPETSGTPSAASAFSRTNACGRRSRNV